MTATTNVLVERNGAVTTVILNRPEVRNAVDRLGRELLARAGLAFDQHGRVTRRRHLEHGEQLAHRDALPRHLPEVISIAGWERRRD